MRKNDYTGAVLLPVRGEGEIEFRFTWSAVAELQTKFGKKEWEEKFREIVGDMDVEGLALLASIATDRPREWWLEESPPVAEVAQAVGDALTIAFVGGGGIQKSDNPPAALQFWTRLWRAMNRGSNSGAIPSNSGA